MERFTKSGLVGFIEMAAAKGLMNTNTALALRTACNKILEDLGEDADVREVDVMSEVLRYNNRHPGDLSPDSLRTYEKRVRSAITHFVSYVENPMEYKPKPSGRQPNGLPRPEAKARDESKPKRSTEGARATPAGMALVSPPVAGAVTGTSLVMPFPLRHDFLVQVVLPRDLTTEEAERLCVFIRALAHEPVSTHAAQ